MTGKSTIGVLQRELNEALQQRNDECRLRQGAERRYAECLDRIATLEAIADARMEHINRLEAENAVLRVAAGPLVVAALETEAKS